MGVITTITLIIALLGGNALFVAAEFALISSRRDRIENLIANGNTRANRVLGAISHLSINLAACQLGITICSLILGKVAEPAIAHYLTIPFEHLGIPHQLLHPLSFVLALAIITYLHILLGEMVPKNKTHTNPQKQHNPHPQNNPHKPQTHHTPPPPTHPHPPPPQLSFYRPGDLRDLHLSRIVCSVRCE